MERPAAALSDLADHGYGLRLAALVLFGIAAAGLLTFFMYSLIASTQQQLDESERIQMLDFVRVRHDEVSERKNRKPEKPAASKAPPAPPTTEMSSADMAANTLTVSDIPASTDSADIEFGFGFGSGDGEYLPIVKVTPMYPMQALMRKLEGTCLVEYTVTVTGAVRDVRVVQNQCANRVFYDVSLEAAKKFKYKPRVIDGEAIEVPGVRNMFVFEIDENQ